MKPAFLMITDKWQWHAIACCVSCRDAFISIKYACIGAPQQQQQQQRQQQKAKVLHDRLQQVEVQKPYIK
jgi:hypothetical protein